MLSGLLASQNDTPLGGQLSSGDWDLFAGERDLGKFSDGYSQL